MVRLLVLCLLTCLPLGAQAATLTRSGATGVDLDGTLYNLEFVTGTCAEIFSGCDEASDFALDERLAGFAKFRLQQMIDAAPLIDAYLQINGCSEIHQQDNCQIMTPYSRLAAGGGVWHIRTENWEGEEDDADGSYYTCCLRPESIASNDYETFARWTRASEDLPPAGTVPLPASAVLLLTGLAGLGGGARVMQRRKRP